MIRPRITIAGLMVIVLYVALGFAALTNANYFWADATYTLAIISIATALLGTIVRKGTARVPWIGYAVFGWTYVLLDVLPSWVNSGFGFARVTRPNLMLMWGIGQLKPYISSSPNLLPFDQVSYSLGMILFGLIGIVVARVVAVKDAPPNP